MQYRSLGFATHELPADVSDTMKEDPSFKGKVYTLQEQIERAKRGSKAVHAGNFYLLDDLLNDD